MSEALIRDLASCLGKEIFNGLQHPRAGFFAKKGIGTYESFLQEAGLRPPYRVPLPHTPEGRSFQAACLDKARTIANNVVRSGGLGEPLRAEVIAGPRTLHRVVNQGEEGNPTGEWGSWWFDDKVLGTVIEASRKDGAQILPDRVFRARLRDGLRRALAVRVDWNGMVYLCSMKVLHGRFPAVTGIGRAQPERTLGPLEREEVPTLRGGYTQIWLPWTPAVGLDTTLLT